MGHCSGRPHPSACVKGSRYGQVARDDSSTLPAG